MSLLTGAEATPTPAPVNNDTKVNTAVKTGDTNNLVPFLLSFALAGLAVVVLVARKRKRNNG